jgi:hypothetical protein
VLPGWGIRGAEGDWRQAKVRRAAADFVRHESQCAAPGMMRRRRFRPAELGAGEERSRTGRKRSAATGGGSARRMPSRLVSGPDKRRCLAVLRVHAGQDAPVRQRGMPERHAACGRPFRRRMPQVGHSGFCLLPCRSRACAGGFRRPAVGFICHGRNAGRRRARNAVGGARGGNRDGDRWHFYNTRACAGGFRRPAVGCICEGRNTG